jgi:hypothetical protein
MIVSFLSLEVACGHGLKLSIQPKRLVCDMNEIHKISKERFSTLQKDGGQANENNRFFLGIYILIFALVNVFLTFEL